MISPYSFHSINLDSFHKRMLLVKLAVQGEFKKAALFEKKAFKNLPQGKKCFKPSCTTASLEDREYT
jgi:hypothetical protein